MSPYDKRVQLDSFVMLQTIAALNSSFSFLLSPIYVVLSDRLVPANMLLQNSTLYSVVHAAAPIECVDSASLRVYTLRIHDRKLHFDTPPFLPCEAGKASHILISDELGFLSTSRFALLQSGPGFQVRTHLRADAP